MWMMNLKSPGINQSRNLWARWWEQQAAEGKSEACNLYVTSSLHLSYFLRNAQFPHAKFKRFGLYAFPVHLQRGDSFWGAGWSEVWIMSLKSWDSLALARSPCQIWADMMWFHLPWTSLHGSGHQAPPLGLSASTSQSIYTTGRPHTFQPLCSDPAEASSSALSTLPLGRFSWPRGSSLVPTHMWQYPSPVITPGCPLPPQPQQTPSPVPPSSPSLQIRQLAGSPPSSSTPLLWRFIIGFIYSNNYGSSSSMPAHKL